jgi:site-specific recombinase XerC
MARLYTVDSELAEVLDLSYASLVLKRQFTPASEKPYRVAIGTFLWHTRKSDSPVLTLAAARAKTGEDVAGFLARYSNGGTWFKYHRHLTHFYDCLLSRGEINFSPTNVQRPKHAPQKSRSVIPQTEVEALLDLVSSLPGDEWVKWRDRSIILLYYRARLTVAQVQNLRRGDLRDSALTFSGSGRKQVVVDLETTVTAALSRYVTTVPTVLANDMPLFRREKNFVELDLYLHTLKLKSLALSNGLTGFSPTAYRHAGAAHQLALGIDPEALRLSSAMSTFSNFDTIVAPPEEPDLFARFRNTHPRW